MSCQGITGKQNFVDNSLVLISKLINNCVMFIPCHFCAKYLFNSYHVNKTIFDVRT